MWPESVFFRLSFSQHAKTHSETYCEFDQRVGQNIWRSDLNVLKHPTTRGLNSLVRMLLFQTPFIFVLNLFSGGFILFFVCYP